MQRIGKTWSVSRSENSAFSETKQYIAHLKTSLSFTSTKSLWLLTQQCFLQVCKHQGYEFSISTLNKKCCSGRNGMNKWIPFSTSLPYHIPSLPHYRISVPIPSSIIIRSVSFCSGSIVSSVAFRNGDSILPQYSNSPMSPLPHPYFKFATCYHCLPLYWWPRFYILFICWERATISYD